MDYDEACYCMTVELIKMKKIMKQMAALCFSLVILSACAQTQVSVKPVSNSSAPQKIPAKTPAAVKSTLVKPSIKNQESYVVEAGDTLYGIASRAGLSYLDVASWNTIGEPFTVKLGQRIRLRPPQDALPTPMMPVENTPVAASEKSPVAKPPIAATNPIVARTPDTISSTKPVPSSPIVTKPLDTKPALKPPGEQKPVDTKPVDAKPVVAKPIEGGSASTSAIAWRWPTQGNLIARYVQGDQTQQGINIAGKSGQPINAAGDGTVVYSGAGLVGYGELIIIKHSNEWLSAYAHNKKRLVVEGAKVKAGDQIAEMGRTGVIRDMLHFEIRRNGKPVDPLLFLPKQ
jgi:lipoprotein NlpD